MRRLVAVTLLLLAGFASSAPAQTKPDAAPAQRFVVFFQEWSAALDDTAQSVVAQAAGYAEDHPSSFVHVNGFADPTGSREANKLLTELRAQVVADQLRGDGVPPAHILKRAHGSVQFALSSQESRRVEIAFGSR